SALRFGWGRMIYGGKSWTRFDSVCPLVKSRLKAELRTVFKRRGRALLQRNIEINRKERGVLKEPTLCIFASRVIFRG
ncbi:MAG: hypothetical protein JXR23_07125, partial [Pontiellaceae bacterium]|nr:hypothetical protein [Pontiellaceae bacterium]